ncbi:MAG: hypothetical protein K2K83_05805 [Rikenella sp.]|nr:hypothetical protein [Rikenella sp.]
MFVRHHAFYPAPGFRHSGSGELRYVGDAGYNWSSAIPTGSTYAYFISFNYDGIISNNNIRRGNGYQLRCLQE